MEEKLGQEPAFPFTFSENIPTDLNVGMSKRFYAACAAMQGLLANRDLDRFGHHHGDSYDVAYQAFRLADKLLKQENE